MSLGDRKGEGEMKIEEVTYVGWTYEGSRHVKRPRTYSGEVVRETPKLLVIRGKEGMATIRKALILGRRVVG